MSDDWREDPGLAAWSAFLRVHAAVVPAIDGDLQRATGLPLTWYDVLLELNAAPGRRLRMQDLGERAVLSRTRVSRVVDELAAAGYACRQANPDDRRSSFAAITDAGRRILRKAAPIYLDAVRRHFAAPLGPKHVEAARAALESLLRDP